MPYIDKKQRPELDELIDALANRLKSNHGNTAEAQMLNLTEDAGKLNYVCTRLALAVMGQPKYWKIALISGVLSNVASEFYRKLAIPYEDKKIAENGDVYPTA